MRFKHLASYGGRVFLSHCIPFLHNTVEKIALYFVFSPYYILVIGKRRQRVLSRFGRDAWIGLEIDLSCPQDMKPPC